MGEKEHRGMESCFAHVSIAGLDTEGCRASALSVAD